MTSKNTDQTEATVADPVEAARAAQEVARAAAEAGVEHLRELRARQAQEVAERDQQRAAHAAELAEAERLCGAAEAEDRRLKTLAVEEAAYAEAVENAKTATEAADAVVTELAPAAAAIRDRLAEGARLEVRRLDAEAALHLAAGRLAQARGEVPNQAPFNRPLHRLQRFDDWRKPLTAIAFSARVGGEKDAVLRDLMVPPPPMRF